jgi:hypothetical protein
MNKVIASDRCSRPEITDLPPAISAMIDAAMARTAGSGISRRPVVPMVPRFADDASIAAPAYLRPAKRPYIPAPEDMALVGLFLVVFIACWMTALVGFSIARAADSTGVTCTTQARPAPGQRALPVKLCDRLPQQG